MSKALEERRNRIAATVKAAYHESFRKFPSVDPYLYVADAIIALDEPIEPLIWYHKQDWLDRLQREYPAMPHKNLFADLLTEHCQKAFDKGRQIGRAERGHNNDHPGGLT